MNSRDCNNILGKINAKIDYNSSYYKNNAGGSVQAVQTSTAKSIIKAELESYVQEQKNETTECSVPVMEYNKVSRNNRIYDTISKSTELDTNTCFRINCIYRQNLSSLPMHCDKCERCLDRSEIPANSDMIFYD